MKLGIWIYYNTYHEVYKNKSGTYMSKCGNDLKYFSRNNYGIYGSTENWIYPYCIAYTNCSKLTIDTICPDCLELNREGIVLYIIKAKLGAKI